MRTLYININGEIKQSADSVIVFGKPDNAIINKFFYELGDALLNLADEESSDKKLIVKGFEKYDKEAYSLILEQWYLLKKELFGKNPTGIFIVQLPPLYIQWLKDHSNYVYENIGEALHEADGRVNINVEELYENAFGFINSIEPSEYDQFVVNDEDVTKESRLVRDVKDVCGAIIFLRYDKFKWPETIEEREKIEKAPKAMLIASKSGEDALFPYYGIVLGETPLATFQDYGIEDNKQGTNYVLINDAVSAFQLEGQSSITAIKLLNSGMGLPEKWKSFLGFSWNENSKSAKRKLKKFASKGNYSFQNEEWFVFVTPSEKYLVELCFIDDEFQKLLISVNTCYECKHSHIEIVTVDSDDNRNCNHYKCSNCGKEWAYTDTHPIDEDAVQCPNCGSFNTDDWGVCCCTDCGHTFKKDKWIDFKGFYREEKEKKPVPWWDHIFNDNDGCLGIILFSPIYLLIGLVLCIHGMCQRQTIKKNAYDIEDWGDVPNERDENDPRLYLLLRNKEGKMGLCYWCTYRKRHLLLPSIYDKIFKGTGDSYVIIKDGGYGLYNYSREKMVLQPKYDKIKVIGDNLYELTLKGSISRANSEGDRILNK